MTAGGAADLSKLRINRDDPPPAVKRALGRVLWIVAAAVLVFVVVMLVARRGGAVPVQVVTVSTTTSGTGAVGGGSGSVAVVANGYVVARTKAAVSAKIPGRLAMLNDRAGAPEGRMIPIVYNVRSVVQRPVSTALTALGVGLVVAVFIGMLALANGFRAALARTGSETNAMVLRKGADSELSSGVGRDVASMIAADPHVATGTDGRPLVSPEVYVLIPLAKSFDTTQIANVVVRGVSDQAWQVRNNVKLKAGQRPASGRAEVCVGNRLTQRFPHTAVGQTMRFGGRDWKVVCHFTAAGSAFESEIWGENEQFMPVFRGEVFQSITFRLKDPGAFEEAQRSLQGDKRMTVDVHRESAFYAQQSQLLSNILSFLAIVITAIMAVGAVFGAINTMYAAIASRAPEIGVLLTLGFRPGSVLLSFLAESAIIAAIGGVLGCLFALPLNGIVTSTTNWSSFSEVAFSFRITPMLLLAGLIFAVVMGVLGGLLPALRAARLQVVQALR